jgi:hypothetical protein
MWRVAHALFALALGVCIVLSTAFSGTRHEREQAALASLQRADADWAGQMDQQDIESVWVGKVFWAWAAAEAMLLTGRFLLDSGSSGSGFGASVGQMMGAIVGPGVVAGASVAMRYVRWILAVRADLAVVVFVLGLGACLRGAG